MKPHAAARFRKCDPCLCKGKVEWLERLLSFALRFVFEDETAKEPLLSGNNSGLREIHSWSECQR